MLAMYNEICTDKKNNDNGKMAAFGEVEFSVDKSPSDKDTLTNCAIVRLSALHGIK